MEDEALERLLRGYALPSTPPALDRRVRAEAERRFARARFTARAADLAREGCNALGFGYVNYFVDLVTATDAEYSVELL